jgi:hypothetical protein
MEFNKVQHVFKMNVKAAQRTIMCGCPSKRITAIFENLICELVPFYNQIIPGNFSGPVITFGLVKLVAGQ